MCCIAWQKDYIVIFADLTVADSRKEILLLCNFGDFGTKVCFTFSICPSSGYWSRMDLNCWISDGWIKSNPSSPLSAERRMKEKDIGGKFQRNQTQRPSLSNSGTTIAFPPDGSRLKVACRQECHLSWHCWLSDNSCASGFLCAPHGLWIEEPNLHNLFVGTNS